MSEATPISDLTMQVSKRWDEVKPPVNIPVTDELKTYLKKLVDTEKLTEMTGPVNLKEEQVSQAMMNRLNILLRFKDRSAEYVVDDHNRTQLRALKLYLMGDLRFETEGHGKLHKGVALCGLQGCGKTLMLKMMADAGPVNWIHDSSLVKSRADLMRSSWGDGLRFGRYNLKDLVSCVELEHNFRRDGETALTHVRKSTNEMAFDDLGFENSKSLNYGNRINIMEEVIQCRYNLYQDFGTVTHFSTNLVDASQIVSLYGVRGASRLNEMCNFIYFDIEGHVDRRG